MMQCLLSKSQCRNYLSAGPEDANVLHLDVKVQVAANQLGVPFLNLSASRHNSKSNAEVKQENQNEKLKIKRERVTN